MHTLHLRRQGSARRAFRNAACVWMMLFLSAPAGAGEDVDPNGNPLQTGNGGQLIDRPDIDATETRVAPEPPPVNVASAESPEQPAAFPAAFIARRQYLNNFLVRDRDYRILLHTARSALARGDHEGATAALQLIWDAPADVFVWNDSTQRPESVLRRAGQLMRQMDFATRDAYERCYGSLARRLLDAVVTQDDRAAERELLRRFGHTRSAGQLLELKAQQAMDRGELNEAAVIWKRILDDPWQHAGLNTVRATHALSLCNCLTSNQCNLGDERTPARTDARPDPGLSVRRNANLVTSRVSVPVSEPLWGSSFLDEVNRRQETIRLVGGDKGVEISEHLSNMVETWVERQASDRRPLAGTTLPVVAADLVIVRDFSGVTARAARTGEAKWRYDCETSLCRVVGELAQGNETRLGESRQRTSAAELFARLIAEHSILSTMTTDGDRVYLIDGLTAEDRKPESGADNANRARSKRLLRNRLLALNVRGPEHRRRAWSRGNDDEDPETGLRDFYFLGPPQPHNGALYAIGEQNDQLQIVVLDATSGATRWKQAISLVDHPIAESGLRSRTTCSPLVSQGIVVCPTQLPVLFGLDAVTGMLLWVYHADGEERPDSVTWTHHGRRSEPDECASQPVIAGSRILYLPIDSRKLHCIDIRSGQRHWCQDAHRAEYVACADDSTVMLVSAQECIGLGIADGSLLWKAPIDPPAGRGVAAGDRYLLPLNSGRLAEIHLSDGTVQPDLLGSCPGETGAIPHLAGQLTDGRDGIVPDWFCGNLSVHDDLVICCSSTGVSVFPQARSVLNGLQSNRSTDQSDSPSETLRRAELHMRLAERSAAIRALRSLLQSGPPDWIRERGTRHLRELLYLELPESPEVRLEELADLISTPAEFGRFLLHRLKYELDNGRLREAVLTTCAIRDLQCDALIPMDHNGVYQAHPLEYGRFLLNEFTAAANEDESETLQNALRSALDLNHELGPDRMREAVVLLEGWNDDDSLSLRLADHFRTEGELQVAELVMLRCRSNPEGRVPDRDAATIQSWLSAGESVENDVHHASAESGHPRPLSPSAIEHIVTYRPQAGGGPPSIPPLTDSEAVLAVDIAEVKCDDECAGSDELCPCAQFSNLMEGRTHFLNAAGTTLRLIEREQHRASDPEGRFVVFARDGMTELGSIRTPPARWRLPESGRYGAGHLVPLRGKGVMMLSLLEQRILWHAEPDPEIGGVEPHLGPFGPDFCVLQTGQELCVVDPLNGHLLWRRRGLRYGAGLETNEEMGIVGDSRVLVVFDADRVGYELFDTRSGRSLRRGALPVSATHAIRQRIDIGRRLMYQTEVDGVQHIRIWDPLNDQLLLDAPIDRRLHSYHVPEQQRVALLNGSSLKSVDATTGRCEWQHGVNAEHLEHVRDLLMFSRHGIDFVLLNRHMRDSQSSTTGLDIRVPSEELSGDLYAVDREHGEALWQDPLPVPPSRVLLLSHALPFLVTLSRVRNEHDNENYCLRIDVIDIATGRLVGSRSDLSIIPILHTSYDPAIRQLTLWGPDRHIEIGFSVLTLSQY